MRSAVIVGAGLGGLATALRLSSQGYDVTVLEKNRSCGGRLNELEIDGFRFDVGPSFMSMTYELEELFSSCGLPNPLVLDRLDPLHQVYFHEYPTPFKIWSDPRRLAESLAELEPDLAPRINAYLDKARNFFHDTEYLAVKTNFDSPWGLAGKILNAPCQHLPAVIRNMWDHSGRYFRSEEVRVLFCLIAFFLGSTPYETAAMFSLLNYIEFRHNGYWTVRGGMYQLVRQLVAILQRRGVRFQTETTVTGVRPEGGRVAAVTDEQGHEWPADIFVVNADAAVFRGKVLQRKKFSEQRLDRMDWSFAPFTIYLGVKGRAESLLHHNYFLGKVRDGEFERYAKSIFRSSELPGDLYYYVNVPSKWCPEFAPEGCESLFILCPSPDLRFKPDWPDREQIADRIIRDLSSRSGMDIPSRTIVRKVLTPTDWEEMFDLHRGSGLGLCHGMNQIGPLRPANKDEEFSNLYYAGASTVPGSGLPMVVISSKLVTERISKDHGPVS